MFAECWTNVSTVSLKAAFSWSEVEWLPEKDTLGYSKVSEMKILQITASFPSGAVLPILCIKITVVRWIMMSKKKKAKRWDFSPSIGKMTCPSSLGKKNWVHKHTQIPIY